MGGMTMLRLKIMLKSIPKATNKIIITTIKTAIEACRIDSDRVCRLSRLSHCHIAKSVGDSAHYRDVLGEL
jgi:hypothetical protein